MSRPLSTEDLETVYELIAKAIDGVPADQEALFLSKLSLTLANMCGDVEKIKEAIKISGSDL